MESRLFNFHLDCAKKYQAKSFWTASMYGRLVSMCLSKFQKNWSIVNSDLHPLKFPDILSFEYGQIFACPPFLCRLKFLLLVSVHTEHCTTNMCEREYWREKSVITVLKNRLNNRFDLCIIVCLNLCPLLHEISHLKINDAFNLVPRIFSLGRRLWCIYKNAKWK